jgi:hypothetical protein
MFATARDPLGRMTSLDLSLCPVLRLAIRTCPWPTDEPGKPHHALGLTLDYLAGGVVSWMILAATDFKQAAVEAAEVAKVGFPHRDRPRDRERFSEALKILVNSSLSSKESEAITVEAGQLVELYHDIVEFLWSGAGDVGILGVPKGSLVREHAEWSFCITPDHRFMDWLPSVGDTQPPADGSSLGPGLPAAPKSRTPSRESRRRAGESSDPTPLGAHGKQGGASQSAGDDT